MLAYRNRAGFARLPASLDSNGMPGRKTQMTKLTEYLHTASAAEYIGVAQNTIRKWAARGDIRMHRNPANGYRLFKRSDLECFLRRIDRPVSVNKPR